MTADEGLKCLGDYMFYLCDSLTSIQLPEGLETIGYMAVGYCGALTNVEFPSTLFDIGGYAFYGTPIENIVIPGNVRHIGGDAFSNRATKSLTLNEGIKSIGQYAFAHTSIQELVIPDSVTDLGMQAFYDCRDLKTVKIGFYCNYVPYATFARCTALENVIVPKQLSVVDSAFAGCVNIKNVFYEGEELHQYYSVGTESNENEKNDFGNKYYCEANFYFLSEEPNADGAHWHYNADGKPEVWTDPAAETSSALEYEEAEDGYAVVGVADGCTDTTLVIPTKHNGKLVTEIGELAFQKNETIQNVIFPNTLKRIGVQAFDRCPNLKEAILPDGLEEIGDYAFYNCTSIAAVYIPGSVKEIGLNVFCLNTSLTTVTAGKGLKRLGDAMFMSCTLLSSVEFPEGLERLGAVAFNGCVSLKEVNLPSTLVMTDAGAFTYCPIDDLVIPDSVLHIGSAAFGQNGADPHIKNITFGKELISIGSYAFSHSAIERLEFPQKLMDMGMLSFMGCTSLKYVKFNAHQSYIPYAAFAMCTSLEWVIVPAFVDVTDTAFGGCANLKYVYYSGTENELESEGAYSVGMESNENPLNAYGNKYYVEAEFYIFSEEANPDGRHWHYNADGMPEVWTDTAAEG